MIETMHVDQKGNAIPAPTKCPNTHPVKGTPCEFSMGHGPASAKGSCVSLLPLILRGKKIHRPYYWTP